MEIDIFLANRRFTISSTPLGGYEIAPRGEYGVAIDELNVLLEHHHHVVLRCDDPEQQFGSFAQQYTPITAAGGIVERGDSSILMIHRNGRWDLPKGHHEEGESIEECAIREVEEESGVGGITIGSKLCETLHAYYMHSRYELKRTHWYSMQSEDATPLTPQTEEGIDRAEWIPFERIDEITRGSFPTICSVIEAWRCNRTF